MSLIYNTSLQNFSENPNKIFFHDLENELSGTQCQERVEKIKDFLVENNIESLGICSNNDLFLPLWYIAADSVCKNIFFFNPEFNRSLINSYKEKYAINYISENLESTNFPSIKPSENSQAFPENSLNNNIRNDILFTSGTISNPKGVVVPDLSYLHIAEIMVRTLGQHASDLELLAMPFFHSFGLVRLRCTLLSGSSALICNGLKDFPGVYEFSQRKKITGLSLVPAGLEILKALLGRKVKKFTSNIRYLEIGSSGMKKDLESWVKENFLNTVIYHHYGMTEASRSFLRPITHNKNFTNRDNWIGELTDGCNYKLVNEEDLKKANKGELLIKGKNLFSGYLEKKDNEEKTIDGWFRTGDLCEEINNKIYLLGRLDNQFNIGGQKIQAEELETIIESIETINCALCYQVPEKIMGHRIICMVETSEDLSKSELKKLIATKLDQYPNYYNPSDIIKVLAIPRTQNGKKIRNEARIAKYLDELSKLN